jgi:hypothetical protein
MLSRKSIKRMTELPPNNEAPTAGVGILVVIVAFYWWVHGLAVSVSALGAAPLRNRLFASALLAVSAVGAIVTALVSIRVGPIDVSGAYRSFTSFARRARARDNISERVATDGHAADLCARYVSRWLSAAAVVAAAAVAAAAVWLPMTAYDALGYRVPTIAQWLDAGRISWVSSDDPVRNGYPLGLEAIGAVVAASFGSMTLVDALSLPLLVAGALGVLLSAFASGVRPYLARACGAVFFLAPIGLLNAPSGYVDAAFGGALVALLALLARASDFPGRLGTMDAVAAGMAAALVMSLKGTGFAFVAIAALVAGLRAYGNRSLTVRAVAVFVLVSMPGTFWITRNLIYTGNPLWPIDVSVAGIHLFPGIKSVDAIMDVANNTPPELKGRNGLRQVLLTWAQIWGPAAGFDERLAGLGYAWPLFAVPAIITCVWVSVRERARLSLPIFVVAVSAFWFALQPMRWWSRYTLWLWGAGALALGFTAERWARKGKRATLAAFSIMLSAVCISEAGFAIFHLGGVGPLLATGRRETGATIGFNDLRSAAARAGLEPAFWASEVANSGTICRGSWKPDTDNANLDGVFAQLIPRPRVVVIDDDRASWNQVKERWFKSDCPYLLLMSRSPVLDSSRRDSSVKVVSAIAFDPLSIVEKRSQ